jgi:hypothetical protein
LRILINWTLFGAEDGPFAAQNGVPRSFLEQLPIITPADAIPGYFQESKFLAPHQCSPWKGGQF